MKIAIFHPQLNIFGGGESISMSTASILSKKHQVDIFSPYNASLRELENFFGVGLKNVGIKNLGWFCSFLTKIPFFDAYKPAVYTRKMQSIKGYDVIIDTGTSGMFCKKIKAKTICYINYKEFPRLKKGLKGILNFLLIDPKKAFEYGIVISNSRFTRDAIKKYSNNKNSIIINPPINVDGVKTIIQKNNYILTIGRLTADKKIEIMIEAFKKLHDKGAKGWEFHIIGVFKESSSLYKKDYYGVLRARAHGYPIYFHENMSHQSLLNFIQKCKIYWHARGYGETDTDEMENFGMSTVEAMAAGCVPIVINKGAQPEIVENGKNGFVWDEPDELIEHTKGIIKNESKMKKLSKEAIKKSKQYSEKIFAKRLLKLVESM